MNNICHAISSSIKEGKWLSVTYENPGEKRDTSFWCFIKDIKAKERLLSVSMYNKTINPDACGGNLHFERIKSAQVIDFSIGDLCTSLIGKIENNLEDYAWLHYENFDNNILSYLQECNRLDSDPFQKNYAMISGIDYSVLKDAQKVVLSPGQVDEIVKSIYFNDIKRFENSTNELALSLLSIDKGGKKYIVAYHPVCFNPEDKTLRILESVRINGSFLIEGRKHSLSQYIDISPSEFSDAYSKDPIGATALLGDGLHFGELLDTRPDLMILEREIPVNLGVLFETIEGKRVQGTLNTPVKAFFGDISVRNNGHSEPDIVIYDKRIDLDQMLVLYNTMKNPITYVQGPPGTGKTQTLFNVVISSYFNGRSTLVCSGNNKPVDGIIDKLKFTYHGESIPFPFLRLGNVKEVALATKRIRSLVNSEYKGIPDQGKIAEIKRIQKENNHELIHLLTEYLTRKNLLEEKDFLSRIGGSFQKDWRFSKELADIDGKIASTRNVQDEDVLRLLNPAKEDPRYLSYLYFSSLECIRKLNQPRFADLRSIVEIEDDQTRVGQFNSWTSKDENMKLLVDAFPIIFSTNISSVRLGSGIFQFDLVVMDEAGQCDIARSLIPLARASALLLVGDQDQLKPVILLDKQMNDSLKKKYSISDAYDYVKQSILATMQSSDKVSRRVLLRHHYRCGSKIIGFSNSYFYGNSLRIDSKNEIGDIILERSITRRGHSSKISVTKRHTESCNT